jgi:hypothetical protein
MIDLKQLEDNITSTVLFEPLSQATLSQVESLAGSYFGFGLNKSRQTLLEDGTYTLTAQTPDGEFQFKIDTSPVTE